VSKGMIQCLCRAESLAWSGRTCIESAGGLLEPTSLRGTTSVPQAWPAETPAGREVLRRPGRAGERENPSQLGAQEAMMRAAKMRTTIFWGDGLLSTRVKNTTRPFKIQLCSGEGGASLPVAWGYAVVGEGGIRTAGCPVRHCRHFAPRHCWS
jgi:hypothetical protein